jgi:hypothetical protein
MTKKVKLVHPVVFIAKKSLYSASKPKAFPIQA